MLNRLPTFIPSLSMMLQDIGNPAPAALGKALGVSERTVRGWLQRDHAPRCAMLSVFWLTRWGMSIVDAEAVNAARLASGMAAALQTRIQDLQGQLDRLARIGDFGAANDPTPDVHAAKRQASLVAANSTARQAGATAEKPRASRKKTAVQPRANRAV